MDREDIRILEDLASGGRVTDLSPKEMDAIRRILNEYCAIQTTRVKSVETLPGAESTDMELCEELIELLEELPEQAQGFAGSVEEKTFSIMEWIEKNGEATDRQREAILNMTEGARKWVRE